MTAPKTPDPAAPMDRTRFFDLIDACGADPARWPQDARVGAHALLAADAGARVALERARALDRLIGDGDGAPLPDPQAQARAGAAALAAFDRMHASAETRHRGLAARLREALWPDAPAWQPAAAFALAIALGIALGSAVPAQFEPAEGDTVLASDPLEEGSWFATDEEGDLL